MQKSLQHFIVLEVFGPSGEAQTRGLVVPNHAFYQLNYTRIFNFCHYTTARGKIKDFSVCGQSCGQNHFCAAFGNRGKSRKRRCHKALRRFALPRPGYRHGTPKAATLHPEVHSTKAGALHPEVHSVKAAALHPDRRFSIIP